jgi:hypothetical protein
MATSTEQVTQLIQSFTDLKTFFQGERGRLEQARRDLLLAVESAMYFSGTVDPDNADPDPQDGGTFASLKDLVNASPDGAYVRATLISGRVYEMTENVAVNGRVLRIEKSGTAANPVIKPQPYEIGASNYSRYFTLQGGEIIFDEVDIDLSAPAANPANPFNVARACMVTYVEGASARVGLNSCKVTGADGRGLISVRAGTAAFVSIYNGTFDGSTYIVTDAAYGTAVIAKHSLTLANGAAIADGGTVGQNLLYN